MISSNDTLGNLKLSHVTFISFEIKNKIIRYIAKKAKEFHYLTLENVSLFNDTFLFEFENMDMINLQDIKLKKMNVSDNLLSSLLHLSKLSLFSTLIYLNVAKNCLNSISINSLKYIFVKSKVLETIDFSSNFFHNLNLLEILGFIVNNNILIKKVICQDNFFVINPALIISLLEINSSGNLICLDLRKNMIFNYYMDKSHIQDWLVLN